MPERTCTIEDVTALPEAASDAMQLIHAEFKTRPASTPTDVLLAAYTDETMVGALIAHDFGNRLRSMTQAIKGRYYESRSIERFKVSDWRHQSWSSAVYSMESPPRPAAIYGLKIDYVTVVKPMREKGFGGELVKRAIAIARERGAEEVNLRQVGGARVFYDKLGFDSAPRRSSERRLSLAKD